MAGAAVSRYLSLHVPACDAPSGPRPGGLSRIYPGEYGAEGEIGIRQVFEPEDSDASN
jgi:hypothetical protein